MERNSSDDGVDDQALLAEVYVDLNDTASSDSRQYRDGMDSFWIRSNTYEIGRATPSEPHKNTAVILKCCALC